MLTRIKAMTDIYRRSLEMRRIQEAERRIQEAEHLAEQYQLPIGGGGGGIVDQDEWLYRTLSPYKIDRSLQPVQQERLAKVAVWLWMANPLAYNGIEMIRDYVIGPGFQVGSQNEKVKAVIEEHWNDPINNWTIAQGDRFRDLMIFGEFFPMMFVNPANGHTKIGVVDPMQIEEVICDPENIAVPQKIKIKAEEGGKETIEKWVVQVDETGALGRTMNSKLYGGIDTKGRLVGDVFYFPLNRLLSARRGRSPLLAVADWLDAYDNFLFQRIENIARAATFIWDVTCTKWSEKKIEQWLKGLPREIKSGSIRAHNENQSWAAVFPSFRSTEAKEEARLIMGMILSGMALPEHWLLGQGADVNRASAVAMGDPTVMRLMRLQGYMRYIIRMIVRFHIDQVMMFSSTKLNGVKPEDLEPDIVVPPIDVEDIQQVAVTLKDITLSFTQASDRGWAEEEDLAAGWCAAASRLGFEMKPAESLRESRKHLPAIVKRDLGY